MTLASFYPGETIHVYMSNPITTGGTLVEPTGVVLTYWSPDGTVGMATTSGLLSTGTSTGQYYAALTPTTSQIGRWDYRWSSTGPYSLTAWGAFRVLEPPRST